MGGGTVATPVKKYGYDACPLCGNPKFNKSAKCKSCRHQLKQTRADKAAYMHAYIRDNCPSCGAPKMKTAQQCRRCRILAGHPRRPRPSPYSPDSPPGVIYKITNIVTGKVYVGKTTTTAKDRFRDHCVNARRGNGAYLYKSIRKYGKESFVIEVIDHGVNEAELDRKEIEWIAKLQSTDSRFGYNCTVGGDGRKHSESSRARLKGVRTMSAAAREKLRIANLGRKMPREAVEKVAASKRGKKQKPEHVAKMRANLRKAWTHEKRLAWGRRMRDQQNTPEAIVKARTVHQERWNRTTPEERRRHGEAIKKGWTPEARRKRGESARQWWIDHPEARRELGQKGKSEERKAHLLKISAEYYQSPEAREQARAASLKGWAMRRAG